MDSNHDVWLAAADDAGRPHLIAVSCSWKGNRTARNLASTGLARLAIGSPDDVN
jgi:hypothetical protein